ncbi:MAG: diguanylate cyclase [Firmicutes bacterium]|nr:diguanylate cyclase [Bacillota bacterium]
MGRFKARQIEQKPRDSETIFRIFDNAQVGLFRTRVTGTAVLEANHIAATLLGYKDRDELLSKCVPKNHWVDPRARAVVVESLVSTGEVSNYETEFYRLDGSTVWVRLAGRLCNSGQCFEGVVEDISARVSAEERLRYLSYYDSLTGLHNRAFVEEELLRRANNPDVAIAIGDVNGLKLINDAFGHQYGDQLLIRVANALRRACGPDCVIGRWGGDEFVIVLPELEPDGANKVMEAINSACEAEQCGSLLPSISLGLATRRGLHEGLGDVISRAEERMYRQKLFEGSSIRSAIIASLTNTLRERSLETEEHAERTRELATALGRRLGLSANRSAALSLMATLHDIGKVMIPDHILTKKDPLTQEEWEIIKKHPEAGYRIAQASPDLAPISEAILAHHEWWDGSGYPRGLKGEDIPLLARIIALVDAYDAMVYGRPYQGVLTREEALQELQRGAGVQFDPYLVGLFVEMVTEAATLPPHTVRDHPVEELGATS